MENEELPQVFNPIDGDNARAVPSDWLNVFSGVSIFLYHSHTVFTNNIAKLFESFGALVSIQNTEDFDAKNLNGFSFHVALLEWNEKQSKRHVHELQKINGQMLIYLLIKQADYENTRKAFQLGVTDVISYPFNPEELFGNIYRQLRQKAFYDVQNQEELKKVSTYILFHSKVMREALMVLPRISRTDFNVLISGETGTGKELIARAIHDLSPRSEEPFITVNCGAIPDTLIESELFGHEKGAFTGAISTRRGKFELANNGTLFLDEIGDMPLKEQVKLLRVLEENYIERVGSEQQVKVNVRVITATRINLIESVKKGSFREDLFYRLNILDVHLPALRDRNEDIVLLAEHYLQKTFFELEFATPLPKLDEACKNYLMSYLWPGNVRELRNIMARTAILFSQGKKKISVSDIPYRFDPAKFKPNLSFKVISEPGNLTNEQVFVLDEGGYYAERMKVGETMDEIKLKAINMTLKYAKGNKTEAARILNISPRTILRKNKND